jgi:molybdopterin biosynthesis enzyme
MEARASARLNEATSWRTETMPCSDSADLELLEDLEARRQKPRFSRAIPARRSVEVWPVAASAVLGLGRKGVMVVHSRWALWVESGEGS